MDPLEYLSDDLPEDLKKRLLKLRQQKWAETVKKAADAKTAQRMAGETAEQSAKKLTEAELKAVGKKAAEKFLANKTLLKQAGGAANVGINTALGAVDFLAKPELERLPKVGLRTLGGIAGGRFGVGGGVIGSTGGELLGEGAELAGKKIGDVLGPVFYPTPETTTDAGLEAAMEETMARRKAGTIKSTDVDWKEKTAKAFPAITVKDSIANKAFVDAVKKKGDTEFDPFELAKLATELEELSK